MKKILYLILGLIGVLSVKAPAWIVFSPIIRLKTDFLKIQ